MAVALTRIDRSISLAPRMPKGLNPTSIRPRQAAVRVTASTESWPSPFQ
jgi:hypothetical protein